MKIPKRLRRPILAVFHGLRRAIGVMRHCVRRNDRGEYYVIESVVYWWPTILDSPQTTPEIPTDQLTDSLQTISEIPTDQLTDEIQTISEIPTDQLTDSLKTISEIPTDDLIDEIQTNI